MIEIGDVLLVKGKGLVSFLVKLFTRSKYSHVALAVSNNRVIEIDWKYRLQIRSIEHEEYDVYRLNRGLTNEETFIILSYVYSLIGSKYDFSKIFSLVFEILFSRRGKRIFDNPNKFICSDIIDSAYQKIGVDLVPHYADQDTTPDDLSKSKMLVMVGSYSI